MFLNDLLAKSDIDPQRVIVMRHRPAEKALNKILPWIAAEREDVLNTYQSFQNPKLERGLTLLDGGYIATFLGRTSGTAVFVGLYQIQGSTAVSWEDYWQHEHNQMLAKYGMQPFPASDEREIFQQFNLVPRRDFYGEWKGRLVVGWPPPERSWWRRAHRNEMPVLALLEESAFNQQMPRWHELALAWEEIALLPQRWRDALSQWRGIYHIKDWESRLGYVGSAYGETNILGRWITYAETGHGDNVHLRKCSPNNLRFSILQLTAPDAPFDEVVQLETNWKARLHTAWPMGLNGN